MAREIKFTTKVKWIDRKELNDRPLDDLDLSDVEKVEDIIDD